jgi:ribA/ribD-fused uncharacterized protein
MLDDPIMNLRDIEGLIQFVELGNTVTYLFFWGHQPSNDGSITKSCLSNWYRAPFTSDGITYPTTEHYMMAKKALLFEDTQTYQEILHVNSPKEAKTLGRKVNGYIDEIWKEHRQNIVITGNEAKFSQHPELKQFLLSTQSTVLVESSPYDQIWGIGMAAEEQNIEDPKAWKGLNLLGFALMEVRNRLRTIRDQF